MDGWMSATGDGVVVGWYRNLLLLAWGMISNACLVTTLFKNLIPFQRLLLLLFFKTIYSSSSRRMTTYQKS